jgi:methylmalonyl-CoA mutase
VNAGLREEKVKALRDLRARRDASAVRAALGRLTEAARSGAPAMPPLVECARARATLGEMTAALESVHGRYRPSALAW